MNTNNGGTKIKGYGKIKSVAPIDYLSLMLPLNMRVLPALIKKKSSN